MPRRPCGWERTTVQGRTALYATAGEGVPVVLVHGWALGERSFRTAATHLAGLGCRVLVPALPGFGQTAGLPEPDLLAPRLRRVVARVPGRGGGDRAGGGGGPLLRGRRGHHLHPRPPRPGAAPRAGQRRGGGGRGRPPAVRLGHGLPRGALPPHHLRALLPDRGRRRRAQPRAQPGRRGQGGAPRPAGGPDRRAGRAGPRGEPVTVIYGDQDRIVPEAASEALCEALGVEGRRVRGNHSWLIAHPIAFAEAVAEAAGLA